MGTGTEIAVEAGRGDPDDRRPDRACAAAIALARRTLRTIRLNFFWAYAYNVALIPLAAGVFYPLTGWLLNPMLAAGGHERLQPLRGHQQPAAAAVSGHSSGRPRGRPRRQDDGEAGDLSIRCSRDGAPMGIDDRLDDGEP